jgi:hypothetical protein
VLNVFDVFRRQGELMRGVLEVLMAAPEGLSESDVLKAVERRDRPHGSFADHRQHAKASEESAGRNFGAHGFDQLDKCSNSSQES